ncbi:MAG: hypothetical protein FWD74_03555 [Actinomycetia bacterium]|nr:hypothetical protein [Actinomycetes bacterium]
MRRNSKNRGPIPLWAVIAVLITVAAALTLYFALRAIPTAQRPTIGPPTHVATSTG